MSQGASMYPFLWGSQGLYATPSDYARFTALWLDGGAWGDRRLLSTEAVARILTPVSAMTAMGSDIPQPTNFTGLHGTQRDPARLEPFLGRCLANFGPFRNVEIEVFEHDAFLALDVPGQFTTELRDPDTEGRWASVLVDRIAVSFERDDSGAVTAMNWLEGGYGVCPAQGRGESRSRHDSVAVARYLGWYRDPEGRVTSHTIHAPDGSTFLRPRIPGDGPRRRWDS
jgi:hypothetical protein